MRNLTVHTRVIKNFGDKITDLRELLNGDVHCCTNPDNDDLYVLKDRRLCEISMKNGLFINFVDIDVESSARAVGLEYSSDVEQLWCAYDTGPIITVNLAPNFHQDATNVIPEGLKCIKLSPDREILVLITSDDTVVTLISNFHVISKVDLYSTNYGKNEFVTVGWGKKETQFHGSEGKVAAKATNIVIGTTVNDDEKPRISWRGDGTMFAVGFHRKESRTRFFKIFNREGVLRCTSELAAGLEPQISWKPSGNLIATSQLLSNKHVVAFFEKNGLKHRELVLPFKPNDCNIIGIKWSQDADILSLWLKKCDNDETHLQLWSENNYHWYLKRTIKFTIENPLLYFAWSAAPRAGKRLILLTKENTMIYSFRWSVDRSRGFSKSDRGVVGVVDGKKALITRFRDGIVPPPMAHESLIFDETINSIIFAPSFGGDDTWLDSNIFMCLLSDNRLVLCVRSEDSDFSEYKNIRAYEIEWKTSVIEDTAKYSPLHHFLWFKENIILCSASYGTYGYLCILDLEGQDFRNKGRVVVRDAYPVDGNIEHIVSSPDDQVAYVLTEKTIFRYTKTESLIPTSMELPESCTLVEIIKIKDRHRVLSLTNRGRFFIDGVEIAGNITSFTVNSDFLLTTTLQHALICVRLNEEGLCQLNRDLTIKPWENSCKNSTLLSVRRIERGSNLIIAVSKDSRTILQMPRGNLECIQPRALSLDIIGTLLDELDYSNAFDIIRKQRINLNIIYDHDPSAFVNNAVKFVNDVKNPSRLSLFISELSHENVTETIYKSSYGNIYGDNDNAVYPRERKVTRVCEILREIMEKREDSDIFIQPILTSLVKNQSTSGLEAALRKIKEVRLLEDTSLHDKKSPSVDALRYLLYLVDVNVLFDISLGMYDFELALFVASKSQKDPKEYIPLLNDLKKREINYMKYSIDEYLKRYDSALDHIARATEKFDECLEFICNHDMYAKALKIFPAASEEYRKIAKIYGDVLMKREKYYEAGIMYSRSWYFKSALCAYKAAGSWQDVIVVAMQLDFDPRDMRDLYGELVAYLNREKRHREAAEILVTYLKQHEEAVSVLCEGKDWRDATRIAHSIKRLDLIETHVKPGVGEHAAYLLYTMSRNREKFEKQKIRLATVRQENAARELRMGLGADYDYPTRRQVNDLLSETSSIAGSLASQSSQISTSSGRTYRSSKNRRKQERKLLSIKEGSFFEDLALIRALHQTITITYADKDDVKLVTHMLLNFGNDEIAEKLQNSFGEFINFIECSKNEIWPKFLNDSLDTRDEPICFKDNQPSKIPQSLLESRFMYPPDGINNVWHLDIFNTEEKTSG